jgi:hypothetical protein
MPVTYHEIKDRIAQTVEYVIDFPNANIAKTARDFDVSPNRLRYRLKTGNSAGGQNKKLSPTQELTLYHFLDRLDTTDFPARISFIKSFANNLQSNHTDPTINPLSISYIWPQRFLNRHPEYSTRKHKPLTIK